MAGAGSLVNDVKNVNGILPTGNNTVINRGNGLVGNGTINSSGIEGAVYSGQCNQSSNGGNNFMNIIENNINNIIRFYLIF